MSEPNQGDEYYDDDDEYSISFDALGTTNTATTAAATKPTPKPQPTTSTNPSAQNIQSESSLPPEDESLFSLDLNEFQDKPWRRPGADITDYFNYGFNEDSWTAYSTRQLEIKRATRQGKPAPIRPLTMAGQTQPQAIQATQTTQATTTTAGVQNPPQSTYFDAAEIKAPPRPQAPQQAQQRPNAKNYNQPINLLAPPSLAPSGMFGGFAPVPPPPMGQFGAIPPPPPNVGANNERERDRHYQQ
jgi:pre-mRNA 3'-end-processing factor FIP1